MVHRRSNAALLGIGDGDSEALLSSIIVLPAGIRLPSIQPKQHSPFGAATPSWRGIHHPRFPSLSSPLSSPFRMPANTSVGTRASLVATNRPACYVPSNRNNPAFEKLLFASQLIANRKKEPMSEKCHALVVNPAVAAVPPPTAAAAIESPNDKERKQPAMTPDASTGRNALQHRLVLSPRTPGQPDGGEKPHLSSMVSIGRRATSSLTCFPARTPQGRTDCLVEQAHPPGLDPNVLRVWVETPRPLHLGSVPQVTPYNVPIGKPIVFSGAGMCRIHGEEKRSHSRPASEDPVPKRQALLLEESPSKSTDSSFVAVDTPIGNQVPLSSRRFFERFVSPRPPATSEHPSPPKLATHPVTPQTGTIEQSIHKSMAVDPTVVRKGDQKTVHCG